jgi:hypothetical protein
MKQFAQSRKLAGVRHTIVSKNIEHPAYIMPSFRFTLGVIVLLVILARLPIVVCNEIRSSHWLSSHFYEKTFELR